MEIILVDDGSPDNCGKMCDDYAEKDNRITVIHKENGGLSDARNVALDTAGGEWVFFLDSDDTIKPNTLEFLLAEATKHHAQIAITTFDGDANTCETATGSGREMLVWLFTVKRSDAACGKLFHRSLFRDMRFPKGKLHEDYAIIPQLYLSAKTITYTDNGLYCYTRREDSIMAKSRVHVPIEVLAFTEDHIALIASVFGKGTEEYKKMLAMFMRYVYGHRINAALSAQNKEFARGYTKIVRKYFWAIITNPHTPLGRRLRSICAAFLPRFYFMYIARR